MNIPFEIITRKKCLVLTQEDRGLLAEVDLAIISNNEKIGLLYRRHLNTGEVIDSLTLPLEYDNMFFEEIDLITYLVAVVCGKQLLFKLESKETENTDEVIATKLLPTEYDRIVTCKNDKLFLIYNRDTVSFFDPCDEKVFAECNQTEHIHEQCFLCTTDEKSVIWDTIEKK